MKIITFFSIDRKGVFETKDRFVEAVNISGRFKRRGYDYQSPNLRTSKFTKKVI